MHGNSHEAIEEGKSTTTAPKTTTETMCNNGAETRRQTKGQRSRCRRKNTEISQRHEEEECQFRNLTGWPVELDFSHLIFVDCNELLGN